MINQDRMKLLSLIDSDSVSQSVCMRADVLVC